MKKKHDTVWIRDRGEDGVGVGVNTVILTDTFQSIGLTRVWFQKKTMILCPCESEGHEVFVVTSVNTTLY